MNYSPIELRDTKSYKICFRLTDSYFTEGLLSKNNNFKILRTQKKMFWVLFYKIKFIMK